MIFLSAGVAALSQFLPIATLVVNATPGVRVEIVAQMKDGSYQPASTLTRSFTAGNGPRKVQVWIPNEAKALCAQTIPDPPGPNSVSLRYRSCSAIKVPPSQKRTGKFEVPRIL